MTNLILVTSMPEWLADDLTKLNVFFNSRQAADVSPVVSEVARKTPITFDQFVPNYASVFKGEV